MRIVRDSTLDKKNVQEIAINRISEEFKKCECFEVGNYENYTQDSDIDIILLDDSITTVSGVEIMFMEKVVVQIIRLRKTDTLEIISNPRNWSDMELIYLLSKSRPIFESDLKSIKVIEDCKNIVLDDALFYRCTFERIHRAYTNFLKLRSLESSYQFKYHKLAVANELVIACLAMRKEIYSGLKRFYDFIANESYSDIKYYLECLDKISCEDFITVSESLIQAYRLDKFCYSIFDDKVKIIKFEDNPDFKIR